MYIVRPSGERPGFCWPSSAVCEAKREFTVDKAYGTPTECTTQATALCIRIVNAHNLIHQLMCAPTIEECEDTRRVLLEQGGTDEASVCEPTLNTDPYQLVNHDDPLANPP